MRASLKILLPSILLISGSVAASQRLMVLTIDDLPAQRAEGMPGDRLRSMTDALVSVLERQRIPAVGFVNEVKLYRDDELVVERVRALERWLDAGFELGNHSYSHPDLHRTPLEEFQLDVLQGEEVTRPLSAKRDLPYRYFRHPYLHTGTDLETKQALTEFLNRHGYRVAPVTIDNSEWIFAAAYAEAVSQEDEQLQKRLGEEYLKYMLAMVSYYEDQSRGLFQREIPQILLIHANALNADHLETLLEALRERGYRFVELETALEDPAYESADIYTGPGGITWLHRWAISRQVDADFFRGEPTTPLWVQTAAGYEE